MKRHLFMLLLFAAAFVSWVETTLIVHQKLGGTVEYYFCEKPVMI